DGRLRERRSLGSGGIWELFLPGVGLGERYKYEILSADGELLLKADPYAQETEGPPKTASVVFAPSHRWSAGAGPCLVGAPGSPPGHRADVDLRGAPRLVAAELAGGQSNAVLRGARRRAVGVRAPPGLHARGAVTGDGSPVHRLVGLPGDRVLRPDAALRLARRSPRVRRPSARSPGGGGSR